MVILSLFSLRPITCISSVTTGVYVALVVTPIITFGDIADVGRRVGTATSIVAFGALIGTPTSGAVYSASGGFEAVGYYAGELLLMTLTNNIDR
jgi:MFS transporter, MCT family, solute carrier family 16 (monocarboxylic acid transporters), member 10